jgi:hypothetical protein
MSHLKRVIFREWQQNQRKKSESIHVYRDEVIEGVLDFSRSVQNSFYHLHSKKRTSAFLFFLSHYFFIIYIGDRRYVFFLVLIHLRAS